MPPPDPAAFRGPARSLPAGFPRLAACVVTYPANADSLSLTLADLDRSDWADEVAVVSQPAHWTPGPAAAARTYRRALEHAAGTGCDFALVLEDDVRVCRRLRANLLALPLVARDQCDYLGLFLPDLIDRPWERREPHLGYRLARPLYAGPDAGWAKHRVWGSQAYLLSRRLVAAVLARWDHLPGGQDARVLAACGGHGLPLWYTDPCLAEHAPLGTVFATPPARAPDFDPDCVLAPGPGFQPPEAVPGGLTRDEGELLWQAAAGRRVLELGTGAGRATVCLAQSAAAVASVGPGDPAEAAEWMRRYGRAARVEFRHGATAAACAALPAAFDLAVLAPGADPAGLADELNAAWPRLAPGGRVAVHGYPDPDLPWVRPTVDALAARLRWRRVAQEGYLAVFQTE